MNTMLLRRLHAYVGAFIAPSVIFFALTGAIQLFSLHEAHGDYQPIPIVEKLGRLHKDQVLKSPRRRRQPPAKPSAPAMNTGAAHEDDRPAFSTLLLKWFFLAVALGLAFSTMLGVWIGLTRLSGKATTIALLIAGAAIPVLLLIV